MQLAASKVLGDYAAHPGRGPGGDEDRRRDCIFHESFICSSRAYPPDSCKVVSLTPSTSRLKRQNILTGIFNGHPLNSMLSVLEYRFLLHTNWLNRLSIAQ